MYKIAIIGAGLISETHANAISTMPNAKLVAVVDIKEDAAKKLALSNECDYFADCDEMLENTDIDAVIICLPTFLHEEYVKLFAKHNKHILCEKPIERSVQAAESIVRTVNDAGVIFMTAQVVRFFKGYKLIKEMYDTGELGKVYMAFASRCSTLPTWGLDWLIVPGLGSGAIKDMHVHDVDFLQHLLGPFDYVYCHGNKDHTGCWNHVMSSLAFKSGEKAVAEASFTMQGEYPFSMFLKVAGTDATVELFYTLGGNIAERDETISKLDIYRKDQKKQTIELPDLNAGYADQLAYFLNCVDNNKQPEIVSHYDNMEVIKAVCAIEESVESGEIIRL